MTDTISADELAYNATVERQVAVAVAVRDSWHAHLRMKYGLKSGDGFDNATGAIRRVSEGDADADY